MSAATSLAPVVERHPAPATGSVSYDTDRPTAAQYAAFQQMFAYFSEQLFDGKLPQAILTFSRRARAAGFFAPDRWSARGNEERTVSEIAVNPDTLKSEPPIEIASTFVHEMCHLWQHAFGQKKSRTGYHNREWSERMESLGLMPSSTGEPGGKRVGQKMSDYVINGGRFEQAFKTMPDAWFFPFLSEAPEARRPSAGGSSKAKFRCPTCGDNAWGKLTLMIQCIKCGAPMVRDASPLAETIPASMTSDPADGVTTGAVETADEDHVNATTSIEEMPGEDQDEAGDDEDSLEHERPISDETFARLAPVLLRLMLRARRGGFSTSELASSMRRATSADILAVARRLADVLGVGHTAAPNGGSFYVFLLDGKTSAVEAKLKQMKADARRARGAAKKAIEGPAEFDVSQLGGEDDVADGTEPTPPADRQPTR